MKLIPLLQISLISLMILDLPVTGQVDTLRIVFYNTENFYDPFNDTLTMDEDYLPGEVRAWNYQRFRTKTIHIARALIAAGQWHPPDLIGLCEVENRFVLKQLVNTSPLQYLHYRVVHEESPDPRGVDVALLYRVDRFRVLAHGILRIHNPIDSNFRTRDILHVEGTLPNGDTLHVLVNHWPSKFGGVAQSLPKRIFVARRLRSFIDSLQESDRHSKIVVMGDFNDTPDQESVTEFLKATGDRDSQDSGTLFNLTASIKGNRGTHKFQGEWSAIDQFMISRSLLQGCVELSQEGLKIVEEAFLLEDDESYSGRKPYRTYSGPRYIGGYSDHLPIVFDLICQ